jgi:head-tail adaptor
VSVLESLLNKTLTVEKRLRVSDGQGGWAEAYTSIGTIAGRIRPANANERVVAEQEEEQITHVLYTATLTTSGGEALARGCRVTEGDLTVEVLGARNPSRMDHHWEIDCLERQSAETTELGS